MVVIIECLINKDMLVKSIKIVIECFVEVIFLRIVKSRIFMNILYIDLEKCLLIFGLVLFFSGVSLLFIVVVVMLGFFNDIISIK